MENTGKIRGTIRHKYLVDGIISYPPHREVSEGIN